MGGRGWVKRKRKYCKLEPLLTKRGPVERLSSHPLLRKYLQLLRLHFFRRARGPDLRLCPGLVPGDRKILPGRALADRLFRGWDAFLITARGTGLDPLDPPGESGIRSH